jgi:hypothetical protein
MLVRRPERNRSKVRARHGRCRSEELPLPFVEEEKRGAVGKTKRSEACPDLDDRPKRRNLTAAPPNASRQMRHL